MWRFKRKAEPVLTPATHAPPPADTFSVDVLALPPEAEADAAITACRAITHRLKTLPDDRRLSVVGESHHQDALARAARGRAADFDDHIPVTVALIPEENNRWDRNAVRVDVIDALTASTVGYLDAVAAEEYQPELLALRDAGYIGACPARIAGGGRKFYGIYLHISSARDLRAVISAESGGISRERDGKAYLRDDSPCTVTQEEKHQDALAAYAPRKGAAQRRVQASLAFCTIQSGKYHGLRAIEVRLGGVCVGQLTHAMSVRYGDVLDGVLSRGLEPVCAAYVRTTDSGLQVELEMPAVRN
jgi:hypothetical protein